MNLNLIITILSWLGVILTGSILVPQIFKVFKTKSTKDISVIFPCINLASNITWIVATSLQLSIGINNEMGYALIAVNCISGICALILLTYKLYNEKLRKENN